MNIFNAYTSTKKKLEAAGIEDYVFEAKQIIKRITGFTNAQILTNYNDELTEFQQNNLTAIIKQRELRYPLQYIFGEWSFYGRDFYVGPGVLIPRPETEILAEHSLEFLKNFEKPDAIDLCAGSGCIGITLATEMPSADVTLLEKFTEAARYAERNIKRHAVSNIRLLQGDVLKCDGNDEKYDLIVSNPPYIKDAETELMSPETKYEPKTALFAEENGLQFYRAITENYKSSLKDGGMLAFEVGFSEAEAVEHIMRSAGFGTVGRKKDLNGIDRVVYGIKTEG